MSVPDVCDIILPIRDMIDMMEFLAERSALKSQDVQGCSRIFGSDIPG